MHFNNIEYELGCRNCKTRRPKSLMMIQSDEDMTNYTRNSLINELENFREIQCENCGQSGNWIVFSIYANDNNPVRQQFTLSLYKRNDETEIRPKSGYFSNAELDIAITAIKNYLEQYKGRNMIYKSDTTGYIVVDFLNTEPYTQLSIFDITGFEYEELSQIINALGNQMIR